MRRLKLYSAVFAMLFALVACSDPMQELDLLIESPEGTPMPVNSTVNVIPGGITQQFGSGTSACTEYYVYAIASGGHTVSYDRKVRITIIKDAYTDPTTGTYSPPAAMEQYVLTIPAGAHISANQRVLADAQEEYDQDFTYKVEEITDTAGNQLPGYTLYELTYKITENCYFNQGNGGSGYTFSGCGPSGSGETSYGTSGGHACTGYKSF